MAVHPDFPGLEVQITIDNDALQEYVNPDPESDSKTVTKFIEARDGAQFAVRFVIPGGLFHNYDIRAAIRLDGKHMAGKVYKREKYRNGGADTSVGCSQARINGMNMGQDFQFSKLDIHEAVHITDDSLEKFLALKGKVSVLFYAVKNVRPSIMKDRVPNLRQYKSIPEKALKGSSLSHSASLGSLHSKPFGAWLKSDYIHDNHPFATFHFKYRSLDALKGLCIVPRTPSPTPLEERPVEDLNAAELAQLVTQYRTREAESQRLKREPGITAKRERVGIVDLADDDVKVIEERNIKRRCQRFEPGELIVLD